MKFIVQKCGIVPGLFKVDVDAAFRRVPIKPAHRWTCGIAFRKGDTVACAYLFAVWLYGYVCCLAGVGISACGLPIWGGRERACVGACGGGSASPHKKTAKNMCVPLRGRFLWPRAVRFVLEAVGYMTLVPLCLAGQKQWNMPCTLQRD